MKELGEYTMIELIQLVTDTEQIDETGDASFGWFIKECLCVPEYEPEKSFRGILEQYLVWANGPSGRPYEHG